MFINDNIGALNAWRNLTSTQSAMSMSLKRLSSGLRINTASDDAAGLAISQKMQGQINGMQASEANAQNAQSLLQTAEGSLNSTQNILQRMRQLAVQAASDTSTTSDRQQLQTEMNQLAQEVTRISNTTQYNTKNLMDGTLQNATFQIGANAGQNLSFSIGAMDSFSLGVAGQTVSSGTITANATGLTNVKNIGAGFSGTSLQVAVSGTTAASTGALTVTNGAGNTGTYTTSTTSGTYTGATNASIQIKVASVSGTGAATGIQYSIDGGTTFSATQNITEGTAFTVGSTGMSFNLVSTGGTAAKVGDTFSFQANAAKTTLQLQDSTGANIGSAQTVYYASNNTAPVFTGIGDASTGRTVDLTFGTVANGTGPATFSLAYSAGAQAATATSAATVSQGLNITTQSNSNIAISNIDAAINTVSQQRANMGALSNRLQYTVDNLSLTSQNLTDARSRITDVDMASEMSNFTKNQILQSAGVSMLAQANSMPQALLKLLQ